MIYEKAADLDFRLEELARITPPRKSLFVRPDHFAVDYAINPHMVGNIGTVDRDAALIEWQTIVRLYKELGATVAELPAVPELPDIVFCANQTLPYMLPGSSMRGVILSHMHAPQRAPEVAHIERFFQTEGYEVDSLPDKVADFEGMGDAIWHPGRFLLWGGHGFRSSLSAYEFVSEKLGVPVIALRLKDPDFYHLDTCLCALDESTALICRDAFDADGVELIQAIYSRVLFSPDEEARRLFACNAHCFDGHNVVIQAGCRQTIALLRNEGYNPIEVRTDEFLKAGGSVFCMKQMYW